MRERWLLVAVSFAYLGVLFAIAHHAERRAAAGRSLIANPWVYALSLAVYCSTWTFYGSVGRAASSGIGFLPVYLGPTLVMALWWFVMRKIIRISKAQRITSIADFVASRYGKSHVLGGLVTLIAVVGVIPYISLQLKAISGSFAILLRPGALAALSAAAVNEPVLGDKALYVVLFNASAVARIALDGTVTNEWATPSPSSAPLQIAAGSGHELWFSESSLSRTGNKIGRLDPYGH